MIVEPDYGQRLRRGKEGDAWYCGKHFHDNEEESWRCHAFYQQGFTERFYWRLYAYEEKQFSTTYYIRSRLEPEWGDYILGAMRSIATP